MDEYQALSHTTWECKYHVVFIPKCRRKTLYLELRRHLGEVFHKPAAQKESKIEEGHLMPDHVHMLISSHRSTRCRRWSGSSRVRARSISPGFTGKGSATSWDNTSGPGGTSSTRSVGMRRRYGRTSATKRRRIRGWNNSTSGGDPPLGGTNLWGRVSDPVYRLGRSQF